MATAAITSTLVGCVGCQAGVEYLQKRFDANLSLVTLAQFAFVVVTKLATSRGQVWNEQKIPMRAYFRIVVINFVVNLCNNNSIGYGIHFPLFIIFKSGSLLANMVLGVTLRGYHYSLREIYSVLLVTGGVIIFTIASYDQPAVANNAHADAISAATAIVPPFVIGVILLTVALFLSAYLGILQEDIYQKYGRRNDEVMFFVHFLSLPAFALLARGLEESLSKANSSPLLRVQEYQLPIREAWIGILLICVLQYICVNNVYRLTAVTTSLTVTMVISLRKFLSLFISFIVFGNPFNIFHICGTAFVFIGSLIYSRVF